MSISSCVLTTSVTSSRTLHSNNEPTWICSADRIQIRREWSLTANATEQIGAHKQMFCLFFFTIHKWSSNSKSPYFSLTIFYLPSFTIKHDSSLIELVYRIFIPITISTHFEILKGMNFRPNFVLFSSCHIKDFRWVA